MFYRCLSVQGGVFHNAMDRGCVYDQVVCDQGMIRVCTPPNYCEQVISMHTTGIVTCFDIFVCIKGKIQIINGLAPEYTYLIRYQLSTKTEEIKLVVGPATPNRFWKIAYRENSIVSQIYFKNCFYQVLIISRKMQSKNTHFASSGN